MISLAGALTMVGILGWTGELRRSASWDENWAMIGSASAGAFLSGLVFAALFGRGGRAGWALSVLGAILATALGASLGGGVFSVVSGAMRELEMFLIYSPLVVFVSLASPVTGPLWAAAMVATHLVSRRLRKN